jgi:hypothetical protein
MKVATTIQERLAQIPDSYKAKMMFIIKKELKKQEEMKQNEGTPTAEINLTPAEREILKLKIISYSKKNEKFKNNLDLKLNEKTEELKNNPELIEIGNKNREEAKNIKSLSESEYKDLENMLEKEIIKMSDMPQAIIRAFLKYKYEKRTQK